MLNADTMRTWDDDRVAALKQLWADGLSASQIAAELGGGISRNAVVGKVHRLRLAGRMRHDPAGGGVVRERKKRKRKAAFCRLSLEGGAQIAAAEFAAIEASAVTDAEIPEAQRLTLLELRDGACRWPIGHPGSADFFFCGGEAVADKPYCAGHCARAYHGRGAAA